MQYRRAGRTNFTVSERNGHVEAAATVTCGTVTVHAVNSDALLLQLHVAYIG